MSSRLIDSLATTDALADVFSDRHSAGDARFRGRARAGGGEGRRHSRRAPPTRSPRRPRAPRYRRRGDCPRCTRLGNGLDSAGQCADRRAFDAHRRRERPVRCISARRVRTSADSAMALPLHVPRTGPRCATTIRLERELRASCPTATPARSCWGGRSFSPRRRSRSV